MTREEIIKALREADPEDLMNGTVLEDAADMLGADEHSISFLSRRLELLQKWQSKMRDPERTIVCDIIANGQTIEDVDPDRYKLEADGVPVEKLPYDVTVAGGTFRAGVALETFVKAAQRWHRAAYPQAYELTQEQKDANFSRLIGAAPQPAIQERKPLTDEQIKALFLKFKQREDSSQFSSENWFMFGALATESAHGITTANAGQQAAQSQPDENSNPNNE